METLLIVWLACIITWFTPTVTAAVSGGELFFSFLLRKDGVIQSLLFVFHSVIRSFVLSVSRITHECLYGCRPNTVRMDKG